MGMSPNEKYYRQFLNDNAIEDTTQTNPTGPPVVIDSSPPSPNASYYRKFLNDKSDETPIEE